MTLSATESFSGGFVRDPQGRLVTVSSAGGALTASEEISGGFVRDQDGRLMTVTSGGGALAAGEQISGGFVRDAVGRLMVVAAAGGAWSGGWLRDPYGRLVTAASGGGLLAAGEAPSGGIVRDSSGRSTTLSGGGTMPGVTVAPAVTGSTTVGSTLTCSQGTGTNPPTGYTYQWQRDGSNIVGQTANTYVVVSADQGHALSCIVTATNASGSTPASSNSVSIPLPAAPTNSVLPAITGTASVGSTLTCSQGTWTGSPTGYTYQWQQDGTPIAGQTSSTYVPVAGDVSHTISCVVTASNAGGSASATAAGVVISATLTYVTVVKADAPLVYYRMGSPSGTEPEQMGGTAGTFAGTGLRAQANLMPNATGASFSPNAGNNNVMTGTLPSALGGSNAWSIECWVNTTRGFANPTEVVIENGTGFGFAMGFRSATTVFVGRGGNNYDVTISPGLSLSTPYHMVATMDASGNAIVYINGAQRGTVACGAAGAASTASFSTPGAFGGNVTDFVQEVAIYNKVLTPAQVLAHFNAA